jgi:hypothetical protein
MGSTSGTNLTRSFVLHTERHRHLIEFLDRVRAENPQGVSVVIREALEMYLKRETTGQAVLTAADVEAACQRAIEQALVGRVVQVDGKSEVITTSPETEASKGLRKMRDALEEWE